VTHEVDPGDLFDVRELELPGPLVLTPRRRVDARGWLTKLFHSDSFAALGLPGALHELFVTSSGPRVIRGIHYQGPPAAQSKYVTCLTGAVVDVILDIRAGSPTYGRHSRVDLDEERGDIVYVPAGFAHGFAVVSDPAVMLYAVTHVWRSSAEGGVRWDSAGIDWGESDPVVSARDASLPPLGDFTSPFTLGQDGVTMRRGEGES
jgi:dTDP-4-dehydrorhamnose 3,5-epimerase